MRLGQQRSSMQRGGRKPRKQRWPGRPREEAAKRAYDARNEEVTGKVEARKAAREEEQPVVARTAA